ncbi:MAG: DNA-binding protein [Deltaproteobacteria bacterium]|nr:DNA-binding protein [Deltaproteobacteria bacterium]
MDARKHGSVHVVRLDRGEPVIASLTEYLERARIPGGSVIGLGAVADAEIGCYDPVRRVYDRTRIPETRELLSLVGSISRLDGRPFLHAHVLLGAPDHSVVGGHLFEARVAITGEFVIQGVPIRSARLPDEDTGLKLMRFTAPVRSRRPRARPAPRRRSAR